MAKGIAMALALTLAVTAGSAQADGVFGLEGLTKMRVAATARAFDRAVQNTVYFAFNDDRVHPRFGPVLDEQAEWILANPEVRFSVTGHTDKVGSNAYNDALGMRRAQAVMAYLVAKGVEPERLIAMVSSGEEAPVIDTENREVLNRRVTTEVFGLIRKARSSHAPSDSESEEFVRRGGAPSDGGTPPGGQPPAGGGENPTDGGPVVDGGPTGTPPGGGSGPGRSDEAPKNDNAGKDAGIGNGDDEGDPGESEDNNRAGDDFGGDLPGNRNNQS